MKSKIKHGFQLHPALPGSADTLSALAMRSKAHWGYSIEFMNACRKELTLSPEFIKNNKSVIATNNDRVAGFYSLVKISQIDVELWFLFVDPDFVGLGLGNMLLQNAKEHALQNGFKTMIIQADPNASKFYLKAGAVQIGDRESDSIPGRFLPLLEMELDRYKNPSLTKERDIR